MPRTARAGDRTPSSWVQSRSLELRERTRVWLDREDGVSRVVNLTFGMPCLEREGFSMDRLENLVDLRDLVGLEAEYALSECISQYGADRPISHPLWNVGVGA